MCGFEFCGCRGYVLVSRPALDEIFEVEWTTRVVETGEILVEVATNLLPPSAEIYVWIRTPSGDVLFVPVVLYPY